MSKYLIAVLCSLLLCAIACQPSNDGPPPYAEVTTPAIQLNQIGYYPDQPVSFTVADIANSATYTAPASPHEYYVMDEKGEEIIKEGTIGEELNWSELAGVMAYSTSVDGLNAGSYRIYVPGVGYSHAFTVGEGVLHDALLGSIKGLYYQRASQALPEEYAGKWHRTAGHPDTSVRYHPSSGKPDGTFSSPGGWYDAGDYGKYILNGAFPVGQMLTLYEDAGDPAPDGSLNIPESGNGKSDFLDEIKYELDWMLTMQDDDGGLFHKLTTLDFEGMIMPDQATNQRYAIGKSTTASLDFAAAAAQASRVYREYDPAYADRLLTAARRAWVWAKAYPDAFFRNPDDVSTGQYGDRNADDERAWAAAELFATTGEQEYYNDLQANPPKIRFGPGGGWTSYMSNMAAYTLLRHPDRVPQEFNDTLRTLVVTLADSLVMDIGRFAYHQPLDDFHWGSNSDVANAGMLLAAAHQYTSDEKYLAAMRRCSDYLFGHNPNGVSYLTGFGHQTPMFIHHRQSAADNVEEPVPGLLSGGPNSGQQDGAETTYAPDAAPMRSWADQTPSYASNEICLNWNAPLIYVLGYLESAETGRETTASGMK